jgi:hypothetical protein
MITPLLRSFAFGWFNQPDDQAGSATDFLSKIKTKWRV